MKPVLIGESNPYGGDPYYALVPYPDGCSGHRLCRLVLGLTDDEYMDRFDRVNLCDGKWSIKSARERADLLRHTHSRHILLGAKVAAAFGVEFKPFEVIQSLLVLPHPSGLNRMWQEQGAFERARKAVTAYLESA